MAEPAAYQILELSAGTGMLGLALRVALEAIGIRANVAGGCEWESCAAAAFLAGVELEEGRRVPVWDDVRHFVGPRDRGLERVDALCAGYPCQPFSAAGGRGGSRDPRHLWPFIRRIVARCEPGIVFFENVDGHVTLGLGKVLRDLERIGYEVAAGVFSAEEVGAPHLRKRVFVVGRLADAGEPGLQGRLFGRSIDSEGREDSRERPAAADSHPLFPPGRTDFGEWARIVAAGLDPSLMPAIESGVSVVADGLATPADVLRLGGNGIVPLQAAWAFLQLFCCVMDPVAVTSEKPAVRTVHGVVPRQLSLW